MSHARKTIRSAVATILKTTPTSWASVTESRIQSPRQIWPYLMVFAESESSDKATMNAAAIYDKTVTLSVVGLLRLPGSGDTETIEDKMDTVAAEIETKLTMTTLRAAVSKVQTIQLVASKMDVIMEVDGIDHAELHQTWQVSYSSVEGLPETLI